MSLGVVIRFKNSAPQLRVTLAALRLQTRQPDLVVGVDTGSSDESGALLREMGGRIYRFTRPYCHSQALNCGVAMCPTDHVMALSSHTELQDCDVVAKFEAALRHEQTACVSHQHSRHGPVIAWKDILARGLCWAGIYSNSAGAFRREFWLEQPFNERIGTCEDQAWAVEQLRRGRVIEGPTFKYRYNRPGPDFRWYIRWRLCFAVARQYRVPVAWAGPLGTVGLLLSYAVQVSLCRLPLGVARYQGRQRVAALAAWATSPMIANQLKPYGAADVERLKASVTEHNR